MILYLNDDYRGGSTFFPHLLRRIRPEKGKALYFHNLRPEAGDWDPLALHTGQRVRSGEKWISNQWIRERDRHPSGAAARVGGQRKRRKRGRG